MKGKLGVALAGALALMVFGTAPAVAQDENEDKQSREERRKEALDKYDADGDGKLDREERKQMVLDRFDADGNGELDEAEKKEACKAKKKHKRGKKKRRGKRKSKTAEE
ncbi:MAG: EF-hand domain-containing protein [Planctomycetota bacterium]|jgi:Ca2+-binding EF-hand superfamily protein